MKKDLEFNMRGVRGTMTGRYNGRSENAVVVGVDTAIGVGPASLVTGPSWHSGRVPAGRDLSPSLGPAGRELWAPLVLFPPITEGSALHGKPVTCEQNTRAAVLCPCES